jgi:hypothetical protein
MVAEYKALKAFMGQVLSRFGHRYGFRFKDKNNYRDVCHLATCDDAVKDLVTLLGWDKEWKDLVVKNCHGHGGSPESVPLVFR